MLAAVVVEHIDQLLRLELNELWERKWQQSSPSCYVAASEADYGRFRAKEDQSNTSI